MLCLRAIGNGLRRVYVDNLTWVTPLSQKGCRGIAGSSS
jgi:hypothetical protein